MSDKESKMVCVHRCGRCGCQFGHYYEKQSRHATTCAYWSGPPEFGWLCGHCLDWFEATQPMGTEKGAVAMQTPSRT
jgi:hypothetical protein